MAQRPPHSIDDTMKIFICPGVRWRNLPPPKRTLERKPHEEHLLGDEHRLHNAAQGGTHGIVAKILFASQYNILGMVDATMQLEHPAICLVV